MEDMEELEDNSWWQYLDEEASYFDHLINHGPEKDNEL